MLAAGWAICDAEHRLGKVATSPRHGIRRQQWRRALLGFGIERLLLQRILFVLDDVFVDQPRTLGIISMSQGLGTSPCGTQTSAGASSAKALCSAISRSLALY